MPTDNRDTLALGEQRIRKDGVVIIKAQEFRCLEGNRTEALSRLHELIDSVVVLPKRRHPTKPKHSAIVKRLDGKTRRVC